VLHFLQPPHEPSGLFFMKDNRTLPKAATTEAALEKKSLQRSEGQGERGTEYEH
jgi:hypothetical protein